MVAEDARHLLQAVQAGRVTREGAPGMWAGCRLTGADVGLHLRWLRRRGLVYLPLLGPPSLTIDGEAALTTWP